MTVGATLVASFLIVLARPWTWSLGLAGFLVRGGWVLIVAPIVVLPTAVGLGNVVAPFLEDVAFGRRPSEVTVMVMTVIVGGLIWLVGGGLLAAATEAEVARRVAGDEELVSLGRTPPVAAAADGRAWRIVVVRFVTAIPLLLALGWGAIRLVAVAYRELTVPSEVTLPLTIRVLTKAPDAVGAIALTWLVAEALGALAARRVTLLGAGVPAALRGAIGRFLRHPIRCLLIELLPTVVLVAVLASVGWAAAQAHGQVRAVLALEVGSLVPYLLVLGFVALFSAGLVLIAVATAWRGATWTVDLAGTFGGDEPANRGTGSLPGSLAR